VHRVINMVYIYELVDVYDAGSSFIHKACKFLKIIKLLLGIAVCFATHAGAHILPFCKHAHMVSQPVKT
jgi:hypothetical protein